MIEVEAAALRDLAGRLSHLYKLRDADYVCELDDIVRTLKRLARVATIPATKPTKGKVNTGTIAVRRRLIAVEKRAR
jgi:hypothetical protein